jgi:hypothetical protein
MSEKNIDATSEATAEKQAIDRRTYLKLAGVAGSGLGGGVGVGALGSEFSTPARAAQTIVDDFSDSNLSGRYKFDQRGATTSVTTVSSSVTSGADTNVLQMEGGDTVMHAFKGDGDTNLNAYPSKGDTFSCWMRGTNGTELMNFSYGAEDKNNKYYVQFNMDSSHLGLFKYVNGSGQSLAGDWSISGLEANAWYEAEIQWTNNDKHTVTLRQNGSEVTSFSYIEGDSDPRFTANGVGFSGYLSSGETAQFDYATTSGSSDSGSSKNNYQFVDSFEDGKLDAYSFDKGESGASVVADGDYTGSNSLGGSYGGYQSLKLSGEDTEMISTSGLPEYPAAGDTFGCWVMAVDGSEFINITYGVQDHLHRYFIRLHFGNDRFKLYRYEDWDGHPLAKDTTGFSLSRDEWHWVEVDWKTDGTHEAYLYDVNGNLLSEISGSDSTWNSGGIGFDGYFASSGGTVYFDDFTLGKHSADWQGGWGTQPLDAYDYTTINGSKNVSYFEYFINNVSRGRATQTLSDGSTVEYLDLVYNIGGLFHTYKQDPEFDDTKEAKYLHPINSQRRNEISIEVQNADSKYMDKGFDYIKRPAGYTYTSWRNQQEWRRWIDNNLHTVEGQDEIENALERNDNISSANLIPEYLEVLVAMYGFASIPISGPLITAADVLIAAAELAEALSEQDCGLNSVYSDQKLTKAGLVWDYCGDYPLTSVTTQYIVRLPLDDSATVKVQIKAGDGGGKYPADETGVWTIDYNGDGNVPQPTGHTTDT